MIEPFSTPPRDPSSPEARAERAKTLGGCEATRPETGPCPDPAYADCVVKDGSRARVCFGHAEKMDDAGLLASAVRLL